MVAPVKEFSEPVVRRSLRIEELEGIFKFQLRALRDFQTKLRRDDISNTSDDELRRYGEAMKCFLYRTGKIQLEYVCLTQGTMPVCSANPYFTDFLSTLNDCAEAIHDEYVRRGMIQL